MSCPAANQGGGAVAQVMEPDGGQAGEIGDLLERVGDGGGVQRGAVGVGELEPGLGPGVPGVFFFFLLPLRRRRRPVGRRAEERAAAHGRSGSSWGGGHRRRRAHRGG